MYADGVERISEGIAYDLPISATPNRISLPFLRVQERKWLLGTVDVCLAIAWMLGAYEAWRWRVHPASDNMAQVPWAWIVGGAAVWLLISWLAGAYELSTADRFWNAARVSLTVSLIAGVLTLVAYYAFLKTYPRPALALAGIGMSMSVLAWRGFYASVLRRPASATRLLMVGDASLCAALLQAARGKEGYHRVLGFLSDDDVADPHHLGSAAHLDEIAGRWGAHRIVVAPSQSLPGSTVASLSRCIQRGIEVVDFSAAYEEIAGKVAVEHVGDYWLAALPTRPNASSLEEGSMRLLDILGSLVGLALTAFLAPFIAAAIFLESGRPIIFRQERLGRGGKPFTMYKLRSMQLDAESAGARWASEDDERVTQVGRFLRRTHLDELPQFLNVLRGDMSLVGPRPERAAFTEELTEVIPFYRLRLAVRPGITGLKQIRVGYASTAEEHLEVLRHDLYYVKRRSFALNLLIMARTIGSVLGMDGQ